MSKVKTKRPLISIWPFLLVILVTMIGVLISYPSNVVAGQVINASLEPSQITSGISEIVTVNAEIINNNLIPINLELQRVDDNGNITENLGELSDSGDGVYTTQISVTESTPGLMKFKISASVENFYKPIFSEIFFLEIVQ